MMIGKNLAAMRAGDIVRAVDLLTARPDVNSARIRGAAKDQAGIWLLAAMALDPRLSAIWIDSTPPSLRLALDGPLHRNLHDALLPGFPLRWDLEALRAAAAPRTVIWSDPRDWMGAVVPRLSGYRYRAFDEPSAALVTELLR